MGKLSLLEKISRFSTLIEWDKREDRPVLYSSGVIIALKNHTVAMLFSCKTWLTHSHNYSIQQ